MNSVEAHKNLAVRLAREIVALNQNLPRAKTFKERLASGIARRGYDVSPLCVVVPDEHSQSKDPPDCASIRYFPAIPASAS